MWSISANRFTENYSSSVKVNDHREQLWLNEAVESMHSLDYGSCIQFYPFFQGYIITNFSGIDFLETLQNQKQPSLK